MKDSINIFWFRRDLRLDDNAGLYYALTAGKPVLPIFIFDKNILDDLENKQDIRVSFIYDAIEQLQDDLVKHGSTLKVLYDTPAGAFTGLLKEYKVEAVFTNHDYEPYATKRDHEVSGLLKQHGATLHTFKDQVIFDKSEVMKDNGEPYTVFTPYSNKWKSLLTNFYLKPYPNKKYYRNLLQQSPVKIPVLKEMGFEKVAVHVPARLNEDIARHYDKTRDFPAVHGTTRLGVHLRFGTISIRKLAAEAKALNGTLLNELIWREFYQMILWHYPQVVHHSFKKEYDNIKWRNNEQEFEAWCNGMTGYPIVDAGMRELNATGYMHNRVRMITASFLTKDLLIDWRWGEAYFAKQLLDYDLAANNGGWQWAAGTGCDAAPYFRVFNPYLQTEKFDPDKKYINKWVPELNTLNYPNPIVEHSGARERCLKVYKAALGKE